MCAVPASGLAYVTISIFAVFIAVSAITKPIPAGAPTIIPKAFPSGAPNAFSNAKLALAVYESSKCPESHT